MSGIYIPNAQIPQFGHRISVLSDGHAYYEDMANPYVDLGVVTPVPDHGRLIDADALDAVIADEVDECRWDNAPFSGYRVWSKLDDAPTIIPSSKEEEK